MSERELTARINKLEGRLRTITIIAIAATAWIVFGQGINANAGSDEPVEITASKITIVDQEGNRRILLGSDYEKGRISEAAGIFIFDDTGTERGGFITMKDGSAVIALDAPAGVGNPMRDRLGLKVYKNGAAMISILNNKTLMPVRLISDEDGGGGVEFLDYDLEARKVSIKRLDFKGETTTEQSLD